IRDITALALISVDSKINSQIQVRVPQRNSCFEIFGFDIILDEHLRAWLLEVNTFPDLAASSPLDLKIKGCLVEDMLQLVGVAPCNVGAVRRRDSQRRQRSLQRGRAPKEAAAEGRPSQTGTVMDACRLDVESLEPAHLPDFVKQTEGELQRRGGWQPVLPCLEDPHRYDDLQETRRYSNVILARYFAAKAGRRPAGDAAPSESGQQSLGAPVAANRDEQEDSDQKDQKSQQEVGRV
ncbi:unnamed protein product, partial [Ostreobium quekettii]